jgi:RHS repeat-associated protein
VWATNTVTGNAKYFLKLQNEGNLVIYQDMWDSGSAQAAVPPGTWAPVNCTLAGQSTSLGQSIFGGSSITVGQCLISSSGRFGLIMQTDGNLVAYDRSVTPATPIWNTGTQLKALDSGVAMTTLYFYDALGDLLCVEQHGGVSGTGCSAPPSADASSAWRVRRFTYDSLKRLLTAANPESGLINYTYDADGDLLQKTSPAPNQTGSATQTISYCYDELHRVTGKAYSAQTCQGTQLPANTAVVTYNYDSGANAKGKLVSLTDQAGTASYTYDPLGRVASESRMIIGANNAQISKSLSYDYNLDGSVQKLHYPSGAVVTYTPDSAGRIVSAVDTVNNINYATSAAFQADGQMSGFISGNSASFAGITNSFSYNKRLQPINMSAAVPSQTVFSIGYDFHVGNGSSGSDNGNVWNIYNYRDRTRDQSFTYDALNRLTSAQNAGTANPPPASDCNVVVLQNKTKYWGNSYVYDAWGNLTQKIITKCGAEHLSVGVNNLNRITDAGYAYDAAGNMTADGTDGLTLSYDPENRITGAGGSVYTYDADGNRVKKANGSTGTLYWYMTPGIVGESDLSGVMKSEYVFFNGERVARRDLVSPTGVFYYFSDHLKTASVITDSAGNIKAESDYYPWGGELQFVNADSNHYKFTGKERDSESGLDYFGARYYSNGLGRFITPDWAAKATAVPYAEFADPQSLNLYSYVRNAPTTKIDNDGHSDAMVQYNHCQASSACRAADQKDLKEHPFLHVAGPILVMATAAAIVFVPAVAVDIVRAIGESKSDKSPSPTQQPGQSSGRLPQDVHVNPVPPAANNGNGTVGPSPTQNSALQKDVAAAKAAGHTDIRVNQQQVNAQGQRVGVNRPDLQSTDANGVRHYTEYDRSVQNAADHHARTTANDTNGVTHTKIGP